MTAYRVTAYQDTYEIYELVEEHTSSSFKICPERGGIVISFVAKGEELLYLDPETFYDPKANIRGGIPVLFPISGQLENGAYEWEGVTYTMKNHGLARTRPWNVTQTKETGEASITLTFKSSSETRESYPFDFELAFTYILKDGVLTIRQEYKNLSDREMPLCAGFHPYFRTETKNAAYETDAARYLDYNDGEIKPFRGSIDLADMKESAALLDARQRQIAFQTSQGVTVRMSYSEHFKYVVLWSVKGKPFICVEPWMALNQELNRKQELTFVKPGGSLHAELAVTADK